MTEKQICDKDKSWLVAWIKFQAVGLEAVKYEICIVTAESFWACTSLRTQCRWSRMVLVI